MPSLLHGTDLYWLQLCLAVYSSRVNLPGAGNLLDLWFFRCASVLECLPLFVFNNNPKKKNLKEVVWASVDFLWNSRKDCGGLCGSL